MLFSNDFDGVIETFIEIHKRFTRPNQILILAEEKNIFKMFEESVSIRGGPVMGDLEGKSVVGIKWKHIRETIDESFSFLNWIRAFAPLLFFPSHCLAFNNSKSDSRSLNCSQKQKYDILTFNLEHEPGAGGSTFVRHILWTFRKEYKCAVVKHLSANTPHQILDLWKSDFDVKDNKQSLLTQEENAMKHFLF
jgi:hypothetical protein